ncbi:CBS domain-containing protein [Streptomyces venezuelae]|uniref:CBS domain-containing protein n=1 Tax=Streptomyces venezuelae TaxID=54571 RepID=UPI00123E32D8|nr:CBS domain-containing protein [Streptomyces venezuelae]QES14286.1 CBS domain-containing protein [Streptomyces venezuelae]
MTLVQMQPRPTHAAPAPGPAHPAVADAVATAGPLVCDDMTVEVALAVMAGAHTTHLLVCDSDDQCTGLVTRAQLTAVRESPTYTDRLQLRDLVGDGGPLTSATERDDTPGALAPAPALALALALALA